MKPSDQDSLDYLKANLSDAIEFTKAPQLQTWAITHAPRGGRACEFGVAKGESLRHLAQYRPIIGFDSFTGSPQTWRNVPKGTYAIVAPPEPVENTELVTGPFEQTLPSWCACGLPGHRIAFAHIDCDLYRSTKTVLDHIAPLLMDRAILLFGAYWGYGIPPHNWRVHEHKALMDSDIAFDYVAYSAEQVAIRVKA
jgi:hypothetical protein